MTNLIEQVKPRVLKIHDKEMIDMTSGHILVILTPETQNKDEAWAWVKFEITPYFRYMEIDWYKGKQLVVNDFDVTLEIVEIEGCKWSISESDRQTIEDYIADLVYEIEPELVARQEREWSEDI